MKTLMIILVGGTFVKGFCQTSGKSGKSDKSGLSPQMVSNWPKEINSNGARILVYQPQPDSLVGIRLYARAAVSITTQQDQPVFGAVWASATLNTDRQTGEITLVAVTITNVRFPNQDSIPEDKIGQFKSLLETEIPKWEISGSLSDLTATLKANSAIIKQAQNFDNTPPEIIFMDKPGVLLLFDGNPVFKPVENTDVQKAINTPYFVVQDNKSKQYFLYGGDFWFTSADVVNAPWRNIKEPPDDIMKMQENMKPANADPSASGTTAVKESPLAIPDIIVRTKPAELLQSTGEPDFAPIQETQLLYMTNTDNKIFMAIDQQQYYILISGRWYTSKNLKGPWNYTASENLPPDFYRIPEGTVNDIVLASVAGTTAAKEAIMDSQIPQTAAVDRNTATCTVTYDGDPKFEQIKGTLLYRGVNTSSSVIMSASVYYVCENAVWFIGNSPTGPWVVATAIPADIQKIPPDNPAYNVKYVYIYDVQPSVVYMGYLPGYVGCYVNGPTIVYGTGYQYPCWYGAYYYPRPVTWGFSMNYNPWTGWNMGFGFSAGFIHVGVGAPMYHGGWWGPPMYRPPFATPYNHYYGGGAVYARNTTINVNTYNRNNVNQNNLYNNHRTGVQSGTTAHNRQAATQPIDRQGSGNRQPSDGMQRAPRAENTKNNVFTGNNGEVYRRNGNNWEQNDGRSWQQADRNSAPGQPSGARSSQPARESGSFDQQNMDRQNMDRDRASQQNMNRGNFQRSGGGMSGMQNREGGGMPRGGRR